MSENVAILKGEDAYEIYKLGKEKWNTYLEENEIIELDFEKFTFHEDVNFEKYNFPNRVNFKNAIFRKNANFSQCNKFGSPIFELAQFNGNAIFQYSRFNKANFKNCEFEGKVNFADTVVSQDFDISNSHFMMGANFYACEFLGFSNFGGVKFDRPPDFSYSSFKKGANFSGIAFPERTMFNLTNSNEINFELSILIRSEFYLAKLKNANLKNTNLSHANLSSVEFSNVSFNGETKLEGAIVKDLIVDNYALHYLKDNGGLTNGDRLDMKIKDPVVDLRRDFSGFNGFMHLFSVILWLFPYLWFIVWNWPQAEFDMSSDTHITLIRAILLYVYNGGENLSSGEFHSYPHYTFLLFISILIYNILRLRFLFLTMNLEREQKITGLPAKFSLQFGIPLFIWLKNKLNKLKWKWAKKWNLVLRWEPLYKFIKYSFYFYLILPVCNFGHFLFKMVPLESLS